MSDNIVTLTATTTFVWGSGVESSTAVDLEKTSSTPLSSSTMTISSTTPSSISLSSTPTTFSTLSTFSTNLGFLPSSTPTSTSPPTSKSGLTSGDKAGIGVGVSFFVLGIALLMFLLHMVYRRRVQKQSQLRRASERGMKNAAAFQNALPPVFLDVMVPPSTEATSASPGTVTEAEKRLQGRGYEDAIEVVGSSVGPEGAEIGSSGDPGDGKGGRLIVERSRTVRVKSGGPQELDAELGRLAIPDRFKE